MSLPLETASSRLVQESILRILHGQSFSRASTQASLILTDLLGRYLKLLAQSCQLRAERSGRVSITTQDAVSALQELGVSISELKSFHDNEGKDYSRYIFGSARRKFDLQEMGGLVQEGLLSDTQLNQLLVYRKYEPPSSPPSPGLTIAAVEMPSVRVVNTQPVPPLRQPGPQLLPSPPTTPTSSPEPPRKRPRLDVASHSDYIPDFLPPLPLQFLSLASTPPEIPSALNVEPQSNKPSAAPTPALTPAPLPSDPDVEQDNEPDPEPAPTPAAKASYTTSVPYGRSTISNKNPTHLPKAPRRSRKDRDRDKGKEREKDKDDIHSQPNGTTSTSSFTNAASQQVHYALLNAQHHLLTHPPAPPETQLPSRHYISLSLVSSSPSHYRPPDSLYGVSIPNRLRHSAPPPSFPIANDKNDKASNGWQGGLPRTTRGLFPVDMGIALCSLQNSRIPALAREVLPRPVHSRTTRLAPPPPLQRDSRKLTYGRGVPAPWNSSLSSGSVSLTNGKEKDKKNREKEKEKDKDGSKVILPDATLFATWDWDTKDFKAQLPSNSSTSGSASSSAFPLRLRL